MQKSFTATGNFKERTFHCTAERSSAAHLAERAARACKQRTDMTQQTEAVEVPADTTEVTDVVQVPAATTGEADEIDCELDGAPSQFALHHSKFSQQVFHHALRAQVPRRAN